MLIGGYLWYVAANFQWLHKFGRVVYVNLMDDQGLSMKEMPRGIREMPRSTRDCQIAYINCH